jgi:hypothetical protein
MPVTLRPGAVPGGAASAGKHASQFALLQKKAMAARLKPAHSALVRQKAVAGKNLSSLTKELKKATSGAKGAAKSDLSKVKKAAVPAHKLAAKDAGEIKKLAGAKKKAALKGLAPAHSALVREKKAAGQGLTGLKSKLGKDTRGLKKGLGGIKSAAKQSKAVQPVKKVGAVASKTKKGSIGRFLKVGNQGRR